MSLVKMTVREAMKLGLWERVCEYQGWNVWGVNEGLISKDEIIEFDTDGKKDDLVSAEDQFIDNLGLSFTDIQSIFEMASMKGTDYGLKSEEKDALKKLYLACNEEQQEELYYIDTKIGRVMEG